MNKIQISNVKCQINVKYPIVKLFDIWALDLN